MEKIRLNILGLTAAKGNQVAYALILEEENGPRRLPIIIGAPEAQAIAIALENIIPPRPLTHNLFRDFIRLVDATVSEVFIHKMEKGIFYSEITFLVNNEPVVVDARPSDAIALAVQFDAPIYIAASIMDEVGIDFTKKEQEKTKKEPVENQEEETADDDFVDLTMYSDADLHELMQMAIKEENYELAARIRDELNKRKES